MPQINLLEQRSQKRLGEGTLRVMLVVVAVLLVAEGIAAGTLLLLKSRSQAKLARVEEKKQAVSTRFADYEIRRQKAVALQTRLLVIPQLLERRRSARTMLAGIAEVTPRSVRYTNLRLDDKGKVFLSGTVRTYKELGQLLLALQSSPHVESTILRNVGASTKDLSGVQFDIDLMVRPSIFHISSANQAE